MAQYQGDALFGPCGDGGDIDFLGGNVVRSGGLSGAVYISMMGGNHLDEGDPESRKQWWGNYLDAAPERHIRGRTGTLIAGLPLSSANLGRVVDAVHQDTAWMVDIGLATNVTVEAEIEAARWLLITVTVEAIDSTESFQYRENWEAGLTEPALTCNS
jgi:phage gp46-like protein